LILAGDIGGTNSRFKLYDFGASKDIIEKKYFSQKYTGVEPIIRQFLEEVKEHLNGQWPCVCVIAVAGPVVNNVAAQVTNVKHWEPIDGPKLSKNLKIDIVNVINDFVAVGYGVLGLNHKDEKEILVLNEGKPLSQRPKAVLGAGTGLGEAYLTWNGGAYETHGTEGGHTSFAAQSDLEWRLLKHLKETLRLHHVSAERMVSGLGIPIIYEFLAKEQPHLLSQAVQSKLSAELNKNLHGQLIMQSAHSGDILARRAVELFIDLYGAEAGNLALKTFPFGGLYVAGGIAKDNAALLKRDSRFMNAFIAKGRMEKVLVDIPVYVVLHDNVGMLGAVVRGKLLAQEKSGGLAAPRSRL